MTPDPTIILGVTSFLLLVACGALMLHAAGLRRERDELRVERDELAKESISREEALQAVEAQAARATAAASRNAYIADGVRSLVAQADGNAPQA